VLELDVHGSADGEVVVIHDATLERTTDGRGEVRAHPWAELGTLDAGYHFRRHGELVFRGRGCTLSRLGEVLEQFPNAAFNIEIKQREPSLVRPVLDLLAALGPARVILTAGDDAIMRELEAAKPGCPLGLSLAQARRVVLGAHVGRAFPEYAGRALQIPLSHPRFALGLLPVTTRRVVRTAQRAGMKVHLWTINDAATAARWLAAGVDGIMSDDPGNILDPFVLRWRAPR
jgi:glycerophosphoryl diester phosphodiesterase